MADAIEALFAALERDPDDAATPLILGDALQERGDARGELVSVQRAIASAKVGERAALLAKERGLVAATCARLLGANLAGLSNIQVGFRFGFAERLTLTNLTPVQLAQALTAAFRSPDARLLRTIELISDDEEPFALAEILSDLAKQDLRAPRALRRLRLGNAFERDPGDREVDQEDVDRTEDLRGLLGTFPELVELEVDLGIVHVEWEPLISTALESFAWISPSITEGELNPLAGSKLPALTRFELWTGGTYATPDADDIDDDADGDDHLVRTDAVGARGLRKTFRMLDQQLALRELALPHHGGSISDLVAALAKHAFARRLERLDLSHCELHEGDADELVDLARAAPNLKQLRIEGVTAGRGVRATLARTGWKLVGEWAEEPTRFRFVALGE